MALGDYIRNHNEMWELLIEGTNPYANQLLPQADVDLLRNQLGRDERIVALASGRIVGRGRGAWVVTTSSVIQMQGSGPARVRRFDLADVEAVEAEKGKYGHTLRLWVAGQFLSLYAIARASALLTARALQPDTVVPASPLNEDELQDALHAILDLSLRAQPALALANAETQQLLQQAAAKARADGLLPRADASAN